jgi:hypothetical protein
MASGPVGPVVTGETRKRQREARVTLSHDIDDAIDNFFSTLNDIAVKHAQ